METAARGFTDRALSGIGAYLVVFLGIDHLLVLREHFDYEAYLGFSFLAVFIATAVAAAVIFRSGRTWAWVLGDLICVVTLVGFVVSRTFGLPGYPEGVDEWFDFHGWAAMILELTFLGVSLLALTSRGRSAVRMEQRSLEREAELSPERLEREMAEIRTRVTPDLSDLRSQAGPTRIKERTLHDARRRLRALLYRGES